MMDMHEEMRRGDWLRFSLAAVGIAALMAGTAVPAHGQEAEEEEKEHDPWVWEATAFGGLAQFGDFLEQRSPDGVERELTGSSSEIFGVSIGVGQWKRREVRLTGAFAPTELELQDDDATTGSDAADVSDLADLDVWIVGLEVSEFLTFLSLADGTVAPYVTVGLTGAIWSLDAPPGSPVGPGANDSDSQLQFGALTGAGIRFDLPGAWGVAIEGRRYTLGNPFDGSDAFAVEGETFDEPGSVGLTAKTVAVTYIF